MHSKYVVRLHFALLMEKVFHRLHGLFIAKFQGRMTTIFHTASRIKCIRFTAQFLGPSLIFRFSSVASM